MATSSSAHLGSRLGWARESRQERNGSTGVGEHPATDRLGFLSRLVPHLRVQPLPASSAVCTPCPGLGLDCVCVCVAGGCLACCLQLDDPDTLLTVLAQEQQV